jgi:hypothetical protein
MRMGRKTPRFKKKKRRQLDRELAENFFPAWLTARRKLPSSLVESLDKKKIALKF